MQILIKNKLCSSVTACSLLVVLLTSCQPMQKARLASRPAKQPKFISGIYMTGHMRTGATANAVDHQFVAPPPALRQLEIPSAVVKAEPVAVPALPVVAAKISAKNARQHKATEAKPVEVVAVVEAPPAPALITEEKTPAEQTDLITEFGACTKYADMIGIKPDAIGNTGLYKFIDRWYGTDYRLGGEDEDGIDCSGFARRLYSEVYRMELTRTAMDQYKNSDKRSKHTDEAEEGDLVFFRQRGKRITHVGVYLANGYFIHSSTSQGVVISNLSEEYWHKHYVGIGKMEKMDTAMTAVSAAAEIPTAH